MKKIKQFLSSISALLSGMAFSSLVFTDSEIWKFAIPVVLLIHSFDFCTREW